MAEIESPSNRQSPGNDRNREELLGALNDVRSAIAALDLSGERHKVHWSRPDLTTSSPRELIF